VALNHAIAKAMVEGPDAGLARLDEVGEDPRIAGHYRLDAVRGHLLERAGDRDGAIACYRRAAERTASIAERNYLLIQAAQLRDQVAPTSMKKIDGDVEEGGAAPTLGRRRR